MGADCEANLFSLNDVGVWVVLPAPLRVRRPDAIMGRGGQLGTGISSEVDEGCERSCGGEIERRSNLLSMGVMNLWKVERFLRYGKAEI